MIYFSSESDCADAIRLLDATHVAGELLFSWTCKSDLRLFVKIAYTLPVSASTEISIPGNGAPLRFQECLQLDLQNVRGTLI